MLRRKMRLPSAGRKVGEFDAFIFTAAEYIATDRVLMYVHDIGGCVFCLQRL